MIKNERQRQMAAVQIEKLAQTASEVDERTRPTTEHPRRKEIELAAVRGDLAQLRDEITEYDSLKAGRAALEPIRDLADLPRALIRARIAGGMTQRDLAARLGVAEQQVQRDEANDYASASLERLKKVANAIKLSVPFPAELKSVPLFEGTLRRLAKAGVDAKFIERRLASRTARTSAVKNAATPTLDLVARLARVFGWSPSAILGEGPLTFPAGGFAVAYKRPANASDARVATLTTYSEYCAGLLLQATDGQPMVTPSDPRVLHAILAARSKPITFRAVLEWAWESGITILPLDEEGGFHAMVMRGTSGRSVIVLKQVDRTRWAFDLLHEICHLALHLKESTVRIDTETPGPTEDSEEKEASRFAALVLLGDDADAISDEAIVRANGVMQRLKAAVRDVATERHVPIGALAYHTAFRLAEDGNPTFWGAAVNLANEEKSNNYTEARDVLLSHIHIERLSDVDRDILIHAVTL